MSFFTVRERLLAGSGFTVLAALACLIGAAATVPVAAQLTPPVQPKLSASTTTPKQIINQSIPALTVAQQQCGRVNQGCDDRNPCCPGLICNPCPQCANVPSGRCVLPGR